MAKCSEVRVLGIQHEESEVPVRHDDGVPGVQHDDSELPVHHDDGVPGVQHDEAPLGAGPFGVEGDQQVGGKALIVVNGMHAAQSNLHGDQIVCL